MKCPECGERGEREELWTDEDHAYACWSCPSCGATWDTSYKLEETEIMLSKADAEAERKAEQAAEDWRRHNR